jgi:hypothetical protein
LTGLARPRRRDNFKGRNEKKGKKKIFPEIFEILPSWEMSQMWREKK